MSKRLIACFLGFCVCSLFLFLRIGSLSTNEKLQETANEQSSLTLSFNETRGQIYDCKLNSFTDNRKKYVASCMPTAMNRDKLLSTQSLYSNSPVNKLLESNKPFLMQSVFPETDIPFVNVLSVPKRYDDNQLAQHVIGYTDASGKGVSGIEKAYNDRLMANSSKSNISYQVDGMGAPMFGTEPKVSYAPILTDGVVLTIDSRIQEICEEVGSKLLKKGAIVVMEPSTGKLRAVASFPKYNLASLSSAVKDNENAPLINRAFCQYNVGSTFKIVTAATALSQGISADTTFKCNGEIDVFGQKFGCHDKAGHGTINLKQAMEVSCNPYFIQLGLTLDKQRFYNMSKDLSFGKSVSLAPGYNIQGGYLPSVDELKNPADIANMAFGQGLLMATPTQVAQMVSAVLNGGNTPQAQLVEGYTKTGKLIDEKLPTAQQINAFSKEISEIIKADLISCVMDTPNQRAKPKYVTAGGKTGTAQTGQYDKDKNEILQGWFAGFFPADKPQYVVVVLSEDAQSGNQDASPIFCAIADAMNEPITLPEHLK